MSSSDDDIIETAFGHLLGGHPSKLSSQKKVSALGKIISVKEFLSASECAKLVEASEKAGYAQIGWNPVRAGQGGR